MNVKIFIWDIYKFSVECKMNSCFKKLPLWAQTLELFPANAFDFKNSESLELANIDQLIF